jgi:hypothetical protein
MTEKIHDFWENDPFQNPDAAVPAGGLPHFLEIATDSLCPVFPCVYIGFQKKYLLKFLMYYGQPFFNWASKFKKISNTDLCRA